MLPSAAVALGRRPSPWRVVLAAQQLRVLGEAAADGSSSQVLLPARHLAALASVHQHQHQQQQQHGHCSGSSGSSSVAAAAVAAIAAVGALAATAPPLAARADAAAAAAADCDESGKRQRFAAWMAARGADMSAAAVQPCQQQDAGSGLGLFATQALRSRMTHPWLGRRVGALLLRGAANQTVQVASVPLDACLTLDAALAHPQLGSLFAELLQRGVLDERSAVVLLLLVERARGDASPYAAWLDLLPTTTSSSSSSSSSPLFYLEQQLAELAGTTLASATAARRAALQRQWAELQPVAAELLRQAGGQAGGGAVEAAALTFEQFLWATSIFWSRALALPVTYSTGPAADADSSSSGSRVQFKVLEGLVPGVDFANHSQQPKCWWEVDRAAATASQQQQQPGGADGDSGAESSSGSSHVVKLMANRVCCPRAGEQLTISYGDKGNEELLLLYGFAQPGNPHDSLMVLCPLPPVDEWDPVFSARMQLLQAKGLRPQYFLTASHFEAVTGQPLALASPLPPEQDGDGDRDGAAGTAAAAAGSPAGAGSRSRRSRRGMRRAAVSIIPPGAREVLEVFVLDKHELASALEAAEAGSTTSSSSRSQEAEPDNDVLQQRIQQLGVSMAVLTTFVRLLELKLIAMEGPEGTGSLESDLQQLAAVAHAGDGSGEWRRHCLVYRAGQKALVRGFLTEARAELQDTLTELQALLELQGESAV